MSKNKITYAEYNSKEKYVSEYLLTYYLLFDNSAKVKRQKTYNDPMELLFDIVRLISDNDNIAEIKISVRRYKT